MSQVTSDFRYASRMLWKHRGFTILATLALGIGIGANASIYSLADVLLYRPLLLPDLDRAVQIYETRRDGSDRQLSLSAFDVQDIQRNSQTMEHISPYGFANVALTGEGDPEVVTAYRVNPSLFDALAGKPVLGRTFLPQEGQPNGDDRVVILSHALWTSRFGADPQVIHRQVTLEGKAYQVVGVMQKEFRCPPDAQLWIPLQYTDQELSRGVFFLNVIGRLKPGATLQQANAELQTLAQRISSEYPDTHKTRGARAILVRESISGELTGSYTRMLIGAVGFLLLIACANVANLQFARVSMRGREIAVRSAIGAKRWHIIRHLLAESVLLSGCGVVVGVLIAIWGLDLLHAGMPPEVARYIPGWHRIGLNLGVLGITVAVALLAGIISGIAPAWIGSKVDILGSLKEGSRASAGKSRHHLRSALVVSEIVLSLVLLIGAGLLVKGLRNITEPGPNMDPAHVLKFDIALPQSKFAKMSQVRDFQQELLTRLRGLPGVVAASSVEDLPYGGSSRSRYFTVEGRAPTASGEKLDAQVQIIDPQYFRTIHIPLLSGRELREGDGETTQPVAVVSRRWVQRFLDGHDPMGQRIRFGSEKDPGPWLTIVGVVADVIHEPFEPLPRATVYLSYLQEPTRASVYLLRTSGDPTALAGGVRSQVAAIKADQPVGELQTFAKRIHDTLLGVTYVAVLMGIFGVVALLLSAIGVYGVMAYSVSERTHEIGLRMALGARRNDVFWMVGRWGLSLAAIGMLLGIPAALGLSKLLSGLLFGINAFDIPTFAAGAGVLCAAAMLACFVPVRRAVSVDPMITLRSE